MKVTLDIINFNNLSNCLSMTNGEVELVITTGFGPRILYFGAAGRNKNVFKLFQEQLDKPASDTWQSYGGHRLWHAPEVFPRTYYPDNETVAWEWDGKALALTPPAEKVNMIGKRITVRMAETGSTVTLDHELENRGVWDVELAAWCLSVMAPGGKAVIPQEVYKPHPDCLVPARPLVLWHFTKMNDPRFAWGERYIALREDSAGVGKQKIGLRNSKGWAAYLLGNTVFIKKTVCVPGAVYPDMGCTQEFYTEAGFLEMESLSPLTRLAPGEKLTHAEKWGLYEISGLEKESDYDRLEELSDRYLS